MLNTKLWIDSNELIRQTRKQQAEIDWVKLKLEKAELSGFTSFATMKCVFELTSISFRTISKGIQSSFVTSVQNIISFEFLKLYLRLKHQIYN